METLIILLLLTALSFSNCIIYSESLGTGSMGKDVYVKGEEIQINKCVPFSQIQVGDIIILNANLGKAFESRYNNTYGIDKYRSILKSNWIVHRVIAKFDGRTLPYSDFYPQTEFLVTKGDANPAPDFFFTTYNDYRGKITQTPQEKKDWLKTHLSEDFKRK